MINATSQVINSNPNSTAHGGNQWPTKIRAQPSHHQPGRQRRLRFNLTGHGYLGHAGSIYNTASSITRSPYGCISSECAPCGRPGRGGTVGCVELAHVLALARSPRTRGVANTEAGEEDQDHGHDWHHWKIFPFAERSLLPDTAFPSCSCVDMMMKCC